MKSATIRQIEIARSAFVHGKGVATVVNILWTIAAVLILLWLIGFFFAGLGSIVHILLIIAIIVIIYNLFVGRRGSRV